LGEAFSTVSLGVVGYATIRIFYVARLYEWVGTAVQMRCIAGTMSRPASIYFAEVTEPDVSPFIH
jgi:hypothetical protein